MRSELRPTVPADREFLFELYASTRIHELASVGWPAAQQEAFLRMQFNAQQQWYQTAYPGAEYQIIQIEGQSIGRMIVLREHNAWLLIDISLLPRNRGRGVGSELIRWLIEECSAAGAVLKLQVLKVNPAVRLYQRLGFTSTGEDQIYMQMECRGSNSSQPA